jgi:D-glycero-beta-D-manno-heptose 1-phosphate adenylyltransferase
MRESQSKIISLEQLKRALAGQLHENREIVLCNGCFDTLHVGHVRYLQGAKEEGDVLVAALNADSGVRTLKGSNRPILDEQARAKLVAALRCVDYVIIFREPNVKKLLEELHPDVHAKGTDYSSDTVPERAVAARLGIRVAIVGDSKDHSTQALLENIRKDQNA